MLGSERQSRIRWSSRALAGLGMAAISAMLLTSCTAEDLAPSSGSGADGEQRTLVVTSFGGSFDEALEETVVQPFEAEHNVDVQLVTALTNDAMATVRAQGANSGYDVIQFSGNQETEAFDLGLIEPVDTSIVTNAADVVDSAVRADGEIAPSWGFDATGILYNTEKVEAPTTWEALADPAFQGRVALPDISATHGQNLIISLARINGGSEADTESAFAELPKYAENSQSVYTNGATMTQLFEQDQADLAVWGGGFTYLLAEQQGLPVGFAIPEDGTVLYGLSSQAVAGGENTDLAFEWINFQLDPEIQAAFAEAAGYAPSNEQVELSADLEQRLPLSTVLDKLQTADVEAVANNRASWVESWNRILGQ